MKRFDFAKQSIKCVFEVFHTKSTKFSTEMHLRRGHIMLVSNKPRQKKKGV